jgi:hypothetical protein
VTRRAAIYAANMLPVLVWLGLRGWAQWTWSAWEAAPVDLGLAVRVGLQADNWAMRIFPVATLWFVVLGPFLSIALALAGVVGRAPLEETERRAVLDWWLSAVALSTLTVLIVRYVDLFTSLVSSWAVLLCYSNSLGAAFSVQRMRHQRGAMRWNPAWVLYSGGLLSLVWFPLGLIVPPAVWVLTRTRSGVRSDQAAQPDETQHGLAGGA